MNFVKDFWDIIWEVLGWFQVITFVDPWEEGIIVQAGTFRRVIKSGWWLHLPFNIDELFVCNVRPAAMELDEQSLTTSDDKKIVCKGVMMWSIFDIKKSYCEVEEVEETLEDFAVGIIQEMVEVTEWSRIRTPEFRAEVLSAIQKQARQWGVSVRKFKFQDLVLADAHRIFGGLAS